MFGNSAVRRAASTLPVRATLRFRHLPSRSLSTSQVLRSFARPRIAERSVWESIVPRAFREGKQIPGVNHDATKKSTSNEWNPATFFIFIFLIIGSNAINLIAIRTEAQNLSRKTEARILTLKEAIERVHKGEDVDVKRLLGTDNDVEELEWEEAMREIEAALKARAPGEVDAHEGQGRETSQKADSSGQEEASRKDASAHNQQSGFY